MDRKMTIYRLNDRQTPQYEYQWDKQKWGFV